MGTYRIHARGAWSRLSEIEQLEEVIKFYETMNINLNFTYNKTIKIMISKHYYALALAYEKGGEITRAKASLRKCLLAKPFNKFVPLKEVFQVWRRLHIRRP
jgi:hypothetical protein